MSALTTTKSRSNNSFAWRCRTPRASPGATVRAARGWRHSAKTWRAKEPEWFNAPVPSFGPLDARLLIVGLAPGLQGANRTGRPFTGDYAGVLLYDTLSRYGFARGQYGAHPDDGLQLTDCRITNAVRCVPPENKPTTAEIATCRDFLKMPPSRKCRSLRQSSRSGASPMTAW